MSGNYISQIFADDKRISQMYFYLRYLLPSAFICENKTTNMTDIENRQDIEKLFTLFYEKVFADAQIGYFFTEIAKTNLEAHLPHIADFWEMVLFQKEGYTKNVLQVHQHLHEKSPLKAEHFQRWLSIFVETVDAHFAGENAERAKQRGLSVATVIQTKL